MTGPPGVERSRLFLLAKLQINAFFYFKTYDDKTRKGFVLGNYFYPVSFAGHDDWGNNTQVSFMQSVKVWDVHWIGITAKGYFKSIIRKHPSEECFSWALEWNKNFRLIGFFGSKDAARAVTQSFKKMEVSEFRTGNDSKIRLKKSTALNNDDDVLFKMQSEFKPPWIYVSEMGVGGLTLLRKATKKTYNFVVFILPHIINHILPA